LNRSPAARKRRRQGEEEENVDEWNYRHLTSSTENMMQTMTPHTNQKSQIEIPKQSYQVYNIHSEEESVNKDRSAINNQGSILVAIYNSMNGRRVQNGRTDDAEQSFKMGNAWMKSSTRNTIDSDIPETQRVTSADPYTNEGKIFKLTNKSATINHQSNSQINMRCFSTPPFDIEQPSSLESSFETKSDNWQSQNVGSKRSNFKDWTRIYLFGKNHKTSDIPRTQDPS
jgi:hypothetical protein